ncbi:Methyltransferase domain protein [Theileria parva strain Muguga]|uniref:Methyltransferase type 11 domain-containing protein n=1 Tax=Theileria parva TaxID=5875 RepID=Q4N8A4_THEPA|nr:Methyltransferase domain protein [Theileria parva strain Muguga]EAN33804.1 Methyltransferase domain protein [Theileria parva strain Muguga]|eukprot:XP_766087.1 hypothetical protein [Theileria parva strain Muguga]
MVRKHRNDEPCDKNIISVTSENVDEEEFEHNYVHQIYKNIATHFSHTRYGCWGNVVKVIESVRPSSVILDVGCGNGKYLSTRTDCYFIGVDICSELLHLAREKHVNSNFSLVISNALKLPFKDNFANLTLAIAIIHHLSTTQRRLEVIRELIRCTRTGGIILIYLWSFEQDASYVGYREFRSQDVLVPWNLQQKYSPTKDLHFKRYYHLFNRDEVDHICQHFDKLVNSTVYTDCNNYVIQMLKI